ncbi:survival of motor neuron protein-like [Cottoperca gobio]|uniref:Survival of motor neuron protein-like n=1 Tax=Cottoperca gobio TaxID=56716 RepID=A0A6J2PK56_COTGO|nr:survival of motor neuron protein-like [Cottoperca gobio]
MSAMYPGMHRAAVKHHAPPSRPPPRATIDSEAVTSLPVNLTQEESVTAAAKDETSLIEAFENTLDISQWAVGAQCQAVWSEDGLVYLAKDWKPAARCRAVYSEDSLVYPAVVLWVKGRATAGKGSNWKSNVTSSINLDWRKRKRKRRGENQEERGSQRDYISSNAKTRTDDGNDTPTNHSFSFFPPSAPPPPRSGDPVSFIPPPPLWMFCSSADVDASSCMLMLWYMCGFHTGSSMAQQSESKD